MKRIRTLSGVVASIAILSLQGCMIVGVDYQSPDFEPPDAWAASLSPDLKKGNPSLEKWWKGFNDPVLNELIDRTREANPNLRIASQQIAEARALRGVAQSLILPSANGTGDYIRSRASENVFATPPENPANLYTAGFDAGWEIDVFGGLRRNIESADAGIGASIESYRDILITLFAETARNYVDCRTLQERIRLAQANIDAQEDSVELTQTRLDAGLAPKIDVTQATTLMETSRALIPVFKTQLAQARNRLATLTGGYPASLDSLLNRNRPIPIPKKGFSAGLPADLIRSRPDIRQSERQLAAQTAQIGVAEADLYPRFTLFGNFGLQSVNSSDFFNSGSRLYSFGPAFDWQIFSAGRIRNNINIEEVKTEQALANYENTVLLAVEEVETSMAAIANEWDRVAILKRAVASAVETVDLVKDNYQNGLVDFQRVLDAERTKFSTEDEAAASRGQIAKNYITLYKALGGGSEVEVIPISQPKTKARGGLFGRKRKPEVELIEPEAEISSDQGPTT